MVNRYDEYGNPQTGNYGTFQYTGQMWLGEVGIYNYKARMYWPAIGRFMQTDPVGPEDDPNLYAYVGDDPINDIDPLGLQDCAGQPEVGPCAPIEINGGLPSGMPRFATFPVFVRSFSLPAPRRFDLNLPQFLVPSPKVKEGLKKLGQCAAAQYGIGDGKTRPGLNLGKALSELGALPVYKPWVGIPVIDKSSSFTNVLNYSSHLSGINTRFSGAAVRRFTKTVFGSVRVVTVLGRANVVIGAALLAYDATSIAICTSRNK